MKNFRAVNAGCAANRDPPPTPSGVPESHKVVYEQERGRGDGEQAV